jgi:hypothetical protein
MPDPLSTRAENAPALSILRRQTDHRPSTAVAALSRREQDRQEYLNATRAAEAMRADARRFRDMEEDLTADEAVYGTRAKDYRDGVVARLELVAGWCDAEAVRQDGYAAWYRELVLEDGA